MNTTSSGYFDIRPASSTARLPIVLETSNAVIGLEYSWSDDKHTGYAGWVIGKSSRIEQVLIEVGDTASEIQTWFPRPDIEAGFPQYTGGARGFHTAVPNRRTHRFGARIRSTDSASDIRFEFEASDPPVGVAENPGGYEAALEEFRMRTDTPGSQVLEIGSRVVSPGSKSKRAWFESATYTGFDYYPDANTDVVGDAHLLSQHFPSGKFDGVFSLSVFEHLTMPWVVAREIGKVLKVGGLVLTQTVSAWPLHERPWDFWRMSDDGLRVLFSPPLGFEIVSVGLEDPVRMYFDRVKSPEEGAPFNVAYANSYLLARKKRDVNYDIFSWPMTIREALGEGNHYPPDSALPAQE